MWLPLTFFSNILQPAETRYRAFVLELPIYFSVSHFCYSRGRLYILTNHKCITFAMQSRNEHNLQNAFQFATEIISNHTARGLYWIEINIKFLLFPVNLDDMATAYEPEYPLPDCNSLQLHHFQLLGASSLIRQLFPDVSLFLPPLGYRYLILCTISHPSVCLEETHHFLFCAIEYVERRQSLGTRLLLQSKEQSLQPHKGFV